MPLELAQLTVERLVEEWSGEEKSITIVLFGGEPLINWPVLKRVAEYAEEIAQKNGKQVSFSVTTNGTLLNSERVRFLKNHRVGLMLSTDGLPETHDRHRRTIKDQPSFRLVSKGLQLLQDHYGAFAVRITVMPDTASLLFDSVMFLSEQRARDIVIVPAFGVEWTPENRKVYLVTGQKDYRTFQRFRGQEPPAPTAVNTPPHIDGELIESAWKEAAKVKGFWRTEWDEMAPEQIEVWICYDDAHLYVAFLCHDSQPQMIRAQQRKRGGGLFNDDWVNVGIDPLNRPRIDQPTYVFFVNPLGTQDEIVPGGAATKIEWRGDWRAAAKVTQGWQAENSHPLPHSPFAL